MAKKKSKKKHSFKYSAPIASAESANTDQAEASSPRSTSSGALNPAAPFSYVRRDITRIGFLATFFVVAQLVVWYLFGHTGLGTKVYHLIKF